MAHWGTDAPPYSYKQSRWDTACRPLLLCSRELFTATLDVPIYLEFEAMQVLVRIGPRMTVIAWHKS